jgi:hypothetical protein
VRLGGEGLSLRCLSRRSVSTLATAANAATRPGERGGSGDVGGASFVILSEVRVFPDGRAGAIVIFDGELVYLTFVRAGDRWLIDAWDEGDPVATPAA